MTTLQLHVKTWDTRAAKLKNRKKLADLVKILLQPSEMKSPYRAGNM
jgi:hypothetical protein